MPASSNAPIAFVDNAHCPETFTTGAAGFAFLGPIVTITFESARVDHSESPGKLSRVACQRLVMPVDAAQNLVLALNDFLSKNGLDPSEKAQAGGTKQ
jgi:hypothetical protein